MALSDDLQAKRPGEWTQDDIGSLQRKYKRTHFDHFNGVDLKPQRRRKIKGVTHVWKFGAWRPETPQADAPQRVGGNNT